jgi:Ca2+/Na+ antiporter
MVRNFFRILILGFGAFLLYFSITNKLNWVGFFAIFIVLFLFYLAKYVKILKQANKDASLPTLVEDENLKNSVKSYFEFRLGINNPFREDKIGRKTFYPSGPFGKGYYISDSTRGEEI